MYKNLLIDAKRKVFVSKKCSQTSSVCLRVGPALYLHSGNLVYTCKNRCRKRRTLIRLVYKKPVQTGSTWLTGDRYVTLTLVQCGACIKNLPKHEKTGYSTLWRVILVTASTLM